MKEDGQDFLDHLSGSSSNGFEKRFSQIATKHGLAALLDGSELSLLFQAALCATLCNIAVNGLGGCDGEIKPEREANRINLERVFMMARDRFCTSAGWKSLAAPERETIQRVFLSVFVAEDNLGA
ncbi:MAG TPA: hypothetical protein VNZ64_02895 [Candidatus Acidoferrum sp.]|jgi:hypothetical protein|nr:hypothetical protein [Candidatus Acidoferrum sp.]